jgi:hypothetical protein
MVSPYKTLQTIYSITKDDPHPTTYKCRPRDIILRQLMDWAVIQQHLELLEKEGLLVTAQEETMVVKLTITGIEKLRSRGMLTE